MTTKIIKLPKPNNDFNNAIKVIKDLYVEVKDRHGKFFRHVQHILSDRIFVLSSDIECMNTELLGLEEDKCEVCNLCPEKHPVSNDVYERMEVLRKKLNLHNVLKDEVEGIYGRIFKDTSWRSEGLHPNDDSDDGNDQYETADEDE